MNRMPPKRQKSSRFVENIHGLRAPPNGGGPDFNSVRTHVCSAHGNPYHIIFIHLALSGSLRKKIKVLYLNDTTYQKGLTVTPAGVLRTARHKPGTRSRSGTTGSGSRGTGSLRAGCQIAQEHFGDGQILGARDFGIRAGADDEFDRLANEFAGRGVVRDEKVAAADFR